MKGIDSNASSRWAEARSLTPGWGSVSRSPGNWLISFLVGGATAWVLLAEGASVMVALVASAGVALVLLPLVEVAGNYFDVVPRTMGDKEAARRRIKERGIALLADELLARQESAPRACLEWRVLERQFKALEDHGLWLSRVNSSLSGDTWAIRGGGIAMAELEALCLRGGVMLMASPQVEATLPDDIRQENDPRLRWFKYVAGTCSYESIGPLATETAGDGSEEVQAYRIDLLAQKSALLCHRLSAGQ